MAVDMAKLIMIMRRTEVDNDNEAVVALRMANRMLKADGKTWEDVLNLPVPRSTTFTVDVSAMSNKGRRGTARYGMRASQKKRDDGKRHSDASIGEALEAVGSGRHDVSTLMMIAGIRDHWDRHHWITTDQLNALFRLLPGADKPKGGSGWRF